MTCFTLTRVGFAVATVIALGQVPAAQQAGAPDVRTFTVKSEIFKNTRDIHVYLPPGYDAPEGRDFHYPALYLNDGFAVFSEKLWDVPRQLDQMIRAGTIVPLIVIGIDNAATIAGATDPAKARTDEYLPYADPSEPGVPSPHGQDYPKFLFNEVMPLVERTVRVYPGNIGLGGSSYGAIAALYSAIKSQRQISRLLLESPPLFLYAERLTQDAVGARWPSRVYVGVGTSESADAAIAAKGAGAIDHFVLAANKAGTASVLLHRVPGATHDAAAWKSRFPIAMRFLYGTPR